MTRKWNHGTLWAAPLMAFLVLTALPAHSGATEFVGGNEEIAAMAVHGGSVSFSPKGSFEEMTLTVSGQGHFSSESFGSGATASFEAVDSQGFQLPDGTYKWELVAAPRLEDLNPREFRNGEISADGRTMEAAEAPRGRVQSGVFTIQNGGMVDPTLVEARPVRVTSAPVLTEQPSAAERRAEHTDRDGN